MVRRRVHIGEEMLLIVDVGNENISDCSSSHSDYEISDADATEGDKQ
jgi:hypothetical protein